MSAAVLLLLAAVVPPPAERGRAGAECRASEPGPALRVRLVGLKDAAGSVRVELYPANDTDFLASTRKLVEQGKPFRRVVRAALGPPELCIRAPVAGRYAIAVLHDRTGGGFKFDFLRDGVGFSNNPRLRLDKPRAAAVAIDVGPGVTRTAIVMNYRRGLGFAPLRGAR